MGTVLMNKLQDIAIRLSVTDRCQLACAYCNPEGKRRVSAPKLSPRTLVDIVASLHRSFSVAKVRFTGGEPLLVKELPNMIREVISLGIPDIGVTTNGQMLKSKAGELFEAGLRRINVSCDSLQDRTFRELTGGSVDRTLNGILEARRLGMAPIKLNMVVMRGRNDQEILDVLEFSLGLGLELRFLELMPIGLSPEQFDNLYVSSQEIRERIGHRFKLTPCIQQCGATARRFAVEGADLVGHVGFISPQSHPFCGSCRRLRITSQGDMIGCLAAQEKISLLPALSNSPIDDELIADLAARAFRRKNSSAKYLEMAPMAVIGG